MNKALEEFKSFLINWTEYFKYRAKLRGFELNMLENILRYSEERYLDIISLNKVTVGKHGRKPVLIPYEIKGNIITPVTVHATTRKQINFRIKSGRFKYE